MGIKGLAKLLSDEAPDSIREVDFKSLHGRKIAVDASMAIYQFLIAVRSAGAAGQQSYQLTNDEGETTSHIQGMFNRTIRFLTEGIRPVYVFDGKPPTIKSHELSKRRERRQQAEEALKVASEEGNVEELDKQMKRLVRAGHKENEDCKKLLEYMGVPVVMAPCEAEAQCSYMAANGIVYAAATEDMDALTFQTPVLLRKMTFAGTKKSTTVQSIRYDKAIEGLDLTHDKFVDLCILLGCDYCDTIRGVGPKTALKLIRQYGSIEEIIKNIDRKKYAIPESWIPNETANELKDDENDEEGDDEHFANKAENDENNNNKEELIPAFVQARKLFLDHEVTLKEELAGQIKWKPCQAEQLTNFLVNEMGFNPERVSSNIQKLQAAHKANSKPQTRVDSFFTVKSKKRPPPTNTSDANKKKNATKKR